MKNLWTIKAIKPAEKVQEDSIFKPIAKPQVAIFNTYDSNLLEKIQKALFALGFTKTEVIVDSIYETEQEFKEFFQAVVDRDLQKIEQMRKALPDEELVNIFSKLDFGANGQIKPKNG